MSIVQDDIRDITDGGGLKLSTILHLVCYAALLICLCMLGRAWKDEAVGRARAEATSDAEHRVQASADSRIAAREQQYKSDMAALKQENEKITSQKQAVQVVTKYIPQAAPTEVRREDLKPEVAAKLPDSPSFTLRTEGQEVALGKAVNECQQDKEGLSKCAANLQDEKVKLASMTTERDTWKQTAKGGTKMQRFMRSLKWFGYGAVAGGTAALVLRH